MTNDFREPTVTMTIFGFNTDVKMGETNYHVQSEARKSDLLLQTLVFVKGQCLGKQAVSFAHKLTEPGFSEDAMHELLKNQHKMVVDAIHAGKVEAVIGPQPEIQDVGGTGLSLKCTDPGAAGAAPHIIMRFQVTDHGQPAAGAQVISCTGNAAGSALTDASGNAEMNIPLNDEMRREMAVIVQATHGDKSATRKFRFRKAQN